jgi:hypothetical protein
MMTYNSMSWFSRFAGVGYRYYDIYMNVFPIFEDKTYAFKLWKKTINWWPDDEIKLRFIENGDEYWFILYGSSLFEKENMGFVKNMLISENYQRFKVGYEKKVILRFGIYREKTKRIGAGAQDDNFTLELLKKSKLVYDIKFFQYSDLPNSSIERQCIQYYRN